MAMYQKLYVVNDTLHMHVCHDTPNKRRVECATPTDDIAQLTMSQMLTSYPPTYTICPDNCTLSQAKRGGARTQSI